MNPRSHAEVELLAMLGERLRRYFPETAIEHPGIWVSSVFDQLRIAIAAGDRVAAAIACDLIEKDPHLPFGKLIKSGLSRELRRSSNALVSAERAQVINTTLRLLSLQYAPRELEDYAKLLSKLPADEYLSRLAVIEPQNPKASRIKKHLLKSATANPSVKGTSCGKPQAAPYVER